LKNAARDCGAMAELLIRGTGRPPQCRDEALAAQGAWVAHRRRKVAA
jgi:transposase